MGSNNVVNAKNIPVKQKKERQDIQNTLFFGLFFTDGDEVSLGIELSKYYNRKSLNNIKYYSIIVPHKKIEEGLFNALEHILYILEGYDNNKGRIIIKFDVFGIQKGAICGIFFCHQFEPSCVVGVSEFFVNISMEIKTMRNQIVEYSKQIELHSFSFMSLTLNKNVLRDDLVNEVYYQNYDTNNDNCEEENIKFLKGQVEIQVDKNPIITNQEGSNCSIYRRKSSVLQDLYSWYVVSTTQIRNEIDNVVSKVSEAALMLLFIPEPTVATKVLGVCLEIICIGGSVCSSIMSFDLAIVRPCAREEELKKMGSSLLQAIPCDKLLCKFFGVGFKFEIKRNNQLIDNVKKQWKQVNKELKKLGRHKKDIKNEKKYYHNQVDVSKKRINFYEGFLKEGNLHPDLVKSIELMTNFVYPMYEDTKN